MQPRNTWAKIDIEITAALACQVRVLSEQQLQQGWQPEYSLQEIHRSVSRLVAISVLKTEAWSVIPPQIGTQPLHTWRPGDARPDTWRLSQACRSRWNRCPRSIQVFQATELAGRLFGARAGHITRVIEQRHDLLLAQVFVLYRTLLPELARSWIGENALPTAERGVKNPDAFLMDSEGVPRRVIESAGAYSQTQVDMFHEYCRVSRLPYELW